MAMEHPPTIQSNFKETSAKIMTFPVSSPLFGIACNTFIYFNRSGKDIMLSSVSHVSFPPTVEYNV